MPFSASLTEDSSVSLLNMNMCFSKYMFSLFHLSILFVKIAYQASVVCLALHWIRANIKLSVTTPI